MERHDAHLLNNKLADEVVLRLFLAHLYESLKVCEELCICSRRLGCRCRSVGADGVARSQIFQVLKRRTQDPVYYL